MEERAFSILKDTKSVNYGIAKTFVNPLFILRINFVFEKKKLYRKILCILIGKPCNKNSNFYYFLLVVLQ